MSEEAKEETSGEIGDEAAGGQGAEGMPPSFSVEELLFMLTGELVRQAWIRMGIQVDPATGEATADMPEAKLAVDALSALVPLLEARHGGAVGRDMRNMLTSLQMNYVQRATAKEAVEAAGGEGETGGAEK